MKPRIKTLKNGLQIVAVPTDAPTVTALVLVGTGSNYERPNEGGLSHFLEHMCFKGTLRYPTARIITETLDSLGAISNAFTSHEYTGYYVKGNPKHFGTFLSVLSDIYLNSTFPEAEIEKEKGVIVEEIRMYDDFHQSKVYEELMSVMYGTQPAGLPVIGTIESVKSFARADFLRYKQKHYHAANTVIAVCGTLSNTVQRDIEKAFESIDVKEPAPKKKVKKNNKTFQESLINKEIGQGHLAIGFHSIPYRHQDAASIKILATILGRGMSSRLFLLLREELGAAYDVRADQHSYLDHGTFTIIAGVDKNRMSEILAHIAQELSRIKEELVDPVELSKAKEYAIGMLRLGIEGTDDIANFFGMQLVLGKPVKSIEAYAKEYGKVTAKDVQRVARQIFKGKNCALAVLGPYEKAQIDTAPLAQL